MFARVYGSAEQYRTVNVPITATVQDVLRLIAPKYEIAPADLAKYMLYVGDEVESDGNGTANRKRIGGVM